MRDLCEMGALITDLLESERLAGRHAALHREPVDLPALAREVMADLQGRHPGASSIALHAPHGMPLLLLDRSRMRLLLRNLLDNSLRHTSGPAAPPPELHLRLAQQVIEVEVRDHGPGVPPEHLPHLAHAFYRPDTARQRTTGGVGLGLYLCRLVAQAHGGTLQMRNAEPGLSVSVRLPVVD
jgi:signal transduction histidine kinase